MCHFLQTDRDRDVRYNVTHRPRLKGYPPPPPPGPDAEPEPDLTLRPQALQEQRIEGMFARRLCVYICAAGCCVFVCFCQIPRQPDLTLRPQAVQEQRVEGMMLQCVYFVVVFVYVCACVCICYFVAHGVGDR